MAVAAGVVLIVTLARDSQSGNGSSASEGALPRAEPVGFESVHVVPGRQGSAEHRLKAGDPAAAIDGEDFDGQPMKLSDFKGKVICLVFWAEWCNLCREIYASHNALVTRMKGRDFALVGVNCYGQRENAFAAVKENHLAWRSWFDHDSVATGRIADRYGVTVLPTLFVIDRKGIVCSVHEGTNTPAAEVEREVDELMAKDD
jgi:peroxiredoxin